MLSSIRKQRAVLEVERRKAREATFTEPIHCSAAEDPVEFDQLKQFLTQFYRTIYHRQAEIREILQVEPHVATHYQQLVNTTKQVTMEEFWQRYFYRCDVERLMQQWDRRDASARQARADAFAGSISSVTKLAKSWSEKAVAISSNSRHGSNNNSNGNINSNSTHGTSPTTRPKSAPVSPVSHNAISTTTPITAAPNNLLVAALQTKASDVVATDDVNETITANLKTDIPEPKTPEEEESVVFEDNSTPPRSASTTPTIPPLMNSRILDLLQDDDDDDLNKEAPKESSTAVQPKAADAELKGALNEVKSTTTPTTTPASNAWKGLGSVTVANVSNEASNASPMLTKVTSTKLTSTTSMTTITTGEMPASTPPRPTSSPVLFREWSHSTTTQPPPKEDLPQLPQLSPSSNSALQAPTPADDTESATGASFHGRRFKLEEQATTQLEKLESSLTAKAIVRVSDNTTNPEDENDKTKPTGTTLPTTTESSTGARPLDDVMRDWNRSNSNKTTITTTTTTVQETTTTTSANSNASPEVEPQVTRSEENSNVKDAPASTTEIVTTSTAEAVAADMTSTPVLEEVADSAKVEDVPPSFDEEKQHEVANEVPDEVVAETLNSSAPPVAKEELAEPAQVTTTTKVLLPEGEKSVDEVFKLDSVEKMPEDSSLTDNVKPAEEVVTTSQAVAVESANSNPQDDVQSDSHEETEVLKEEPTILNTISSSDSSNSSDSASLAAIEPPTLEPAKESNLKDTKDMNVEVPLQSSTPPSSRITANSPSKPTRSWFLGILALILLACLAVMSKVAWIWATTTPDGIQYLDALCAPVRQGTTFPLESNVSDEVDVAPVQSFEAPWWAPPAYKKVAFDVVCDSTTPSEVVVPRKRIRLDWITPTRPLAQGHRKNNNQKKKKKQQPQLRRLVITSLINKDNETVEDVLYDAWLSSAVVTATDIQTTDKKGARKTVTKLWAARDRPPISLH